MITYISYDNFGKILKYGQCLKEHIYLQGDYVLELPMDSDISDITHYVSDGNILPFPEKPSNYHIWSWKTHSYIEDIVSLKASKIYDVKNNMNYLKFSPISYDNKLLDADEVAIANISGKIQEILASEALNIPVNNLFWKDYNNIIHKWDNINDYKTWLQGLIISISNRGTLLYEISWAKQIEINNLSVFSEVLDYDTSIIFQ